MAEEGEGDDLTAVEGGGRTGLGRFRGELGLAEVIDSHVDSGQEGVQIQHHGAPFVRKDRVNSVVAEGHLLGKSHPDNSHQAFERRAISIRFQPLVRHRFRLASGMIPGNRLSERAI